MRAVPVTIVTGASEAQLAGLPLAAAHVAVVLHDAAAATEPVPLVGCACCRVGGGLAPALLGLLRAASRGEAAFGRVLVSAPAGAASAVLLEHLASPAIAAAFRVASVVAWSAGADSAGVDADIADHVAPDPAQAGLPWLEPARFTGALGDPGAIRAVSDESREAFVLGWDARQPIAAVGEWLESVVSAAGARLLRLHGTVQAAEGAYALQAVRHVLGPPVRLDGVGDADAPARGSRLRFVTRGLEPLDLQPAWTCGAAR